MPGVQLAYVMHARTEGDLEGRLEELESRHIVTGRAIEKTVRGVTRVEMLVDDTLVGSLFIDDEGVAQDATFTRREYQNLLAPSLFLGEEPQLKELFDQPLKPGEVLRVEVSLPGFGRKPGSQRPISPAERVTDAIGSLLSPEDRAEYYRRGKIPCNVTLIGPALVEGRRTLGIRWEMETDIPMKFLGKEFTYQAISEIGYYDAAEGFAVASYSSHALRGTVGNRPVYLKLTNVRTLDRSRMRGVK